jgi:hypothetical protein
MERVVLARVPFDMPLSEALRCVRAGTRAVVVSRHDNPVLVTAGDIMAAMNAALDANKNPVSIRIGDIVPVPADTKPFPRPLNIAPPLNLNLPEAGVPMPHLPRKSGLERSHFETVFRDQDTHYAIQHLDSGLAVVVTASEHLAMDLGSSVTICSCEGDPVHSFERRQLVKPGICNKPHAKRVTCTTMGGV